MTRSTILRIVVDPPSVTRHEGEKRLLTAVGVVGRFHDGRSFPDGRGQIGEEAPDVLERLLFAHDFIVYRATAVGMNVRAAELFLLDFTAEGSIDDGRTGDEDLTRSAHHDGEVGGCDPRRSESSHRTKCGGNNGHQRKQADRDIPVRIRGDVRPLEGGVRPDTAATTGAIDETHERQPQFPGCSFTPAHLIANCTICRSATHSEIVCSDDHRPATYCSPSCDEV